MNEKVKYDKSKEKHPDRLRKKRTKFVEFCVRIPLFSTKNYDCKIYVLYKKNRGYPPSCPHFQGKLWITLWKRWYFYA